MKKENLTEPTTNVLWSEFLKLKDNSEVYRVLAQINGKKLDMKVKMDMTTGILKYTIPKNLRDDMKTVFYNFQIELECLLVGHKNMVPVLTEATIELNDGTLFYLDDLTSKETVV